LGTDGSPDRLVSKTVRTAFAASRSTVIQQNNSPGQDVFHLQLHVIPRHEGDGLETEPFGAIEVRATERLEQQLRLRVAIAGLLGPAAPR
jgi:diadenosine tetraphosphate (Ap4A) HIT family hydrolase